MQTELRTTAAVVIVGLAALLPGRAEADHATGHTPDAPPEICWVVADGTADAKDGEAPDLVSRIVRADANPETNETNVGTGTGTFNVEAIALQPGTGVLFAADAGTLGTIDLDTGLFTAIGPIGAGVGPAGDVEFDDVDGLSFDATTGFLYGTQRERDEDLLLRIDPVTGAAIAGALGGADYAVVVPVADLPDIDDIAVDPLDGEMYAVANDNGRDDRLVKIDKLTGETTDIGVMQAQDVEGLGFASGQLIGTTGKVNNAEGIWDIDKMTGAAGNHRPLDNARDYEGFDCLNPPNPQAPVLACLEIVENAVPDDPQDFPFTTTGGLPGLLLDDDADPALPDSRTLCDLAAGAYAVTQQTPPDWPLASVDCTDPTGDTTTDLAGGSAAAVLTGGETVRCVFENRRVVVLGEETARDPAVIPASVPAPPPPAAPAPAELPRTGSSAERPLLLLSGMALAVGGLGVIAGARRRRPPA